MNKQINEKLANDVLNILAGWSNDRMREDWKYGASVSNVMESLREMGWANLGSVSDFEYSVRQVGFSVMPAKTKSGFHKWARVIVLA